jgi:hypothetical protein
LFLFGNVGSAANGIVNKWAQAQSYVNDVWFKDLLGKGLLVDAAVSGSGAQPGGANSGPYTNLYYLAYNVTSCTGGVSGNCPICADIEAQTQGLHGLTCVGAPPVSGSNSQGDAAIYINASNNTVEDAHVEAFWDGVEIGDVPSGSNGTVGNITVKNVDGASNGTGCGGGPCGKVTNTVHICGSGSAGNCGNHPSAVKDVTILQVKNGSTGVTSVLDDMTGTSLGSGTVYSVPVAGMYVLGDMMGSGQFSRFSSSPIAAPTWGVGSVSGGVLGGQTCTAPGTLFSNVGGGSHTSVYVCIYNGGSPQWRSITP